MNKHTPGPLAIEICEENGPFLDSFYLRAQVTTWDGNTAERIVCRYPTGTGQFSELGRENLANARLHASAPDLLQAVEDFLLLATLHDWEGAAIDNAREALRKAKGDA
jgi:hypothetical protein